MIISLENLEVHKFFIFLILPFWGNIMSVRAVERALDILLCFLVNKEPTLAELTRCANLNKATVFRLLHTLIDKGFVERITGSERYQLGRKIGELGRDYPFKDWRLIIIKSEMEKLRDLLEETVSLYIRDGSERVRVFAVESNQTIRRVAPIGVRMPLTVGASSKILMAFADEELQNFLLPRLDWQNVNRAYYEEQLTKIKKDGFAISISEREIGTSAISTPIFNKENKLLAALTVSGPSSRLTTEKMLEFVPQIFHTAHVLSELLKDVETSSTFFALLT